MKGLWYAIVLLIPSVMFGCVKDRLEDWGTPTPAGYRVEWEDQGTVAGGKYSVSEILVMFDAAMVRAQKYLVDVHGVRPEVVELYARSTRYHLVDNKGIPEASSPTGYAAGITYENDIFVCLMHREVAASRELIPDYAAPWTIVALADGKYSYGWVDPAWLFPALEHEIGHRIYGQSFEH